jgi:electron transfer flavoprotein beta subunit
VGDAINEPRYPSLKAIMGAKKKPLEALDVAGAGIDASKIGTDGSRVECGNFHAPPEKQAGQIIEDEDTDETVEKIVAWLDERKLI